MNYYYNPVQYNYNWERIPASEIERLQKSLQHRLKCINVRKKKEERIQIVMEIIAKQHYLCAFGKNTNGKWCGNESKYMLNKKESDVGYIKLKWCQMSSDYNSEPPSIHQLCLLCARCNHQLHLNKNLLEIQHELESKLSHVKELIDVMK